MYNNLADRDPNGEAHIQLVRAWALKIAVDAVAMYDELPNTVAEVARIAKEAEHYILTGEFIDNGTVHIPHPKKFTAAG